MVKLFKKALNQTIESIRRTPTLIELQIFTIDAVRIINDRPISTVSDQPNDLAPITPHCSRHKVCHLIPHLWFSRQGKYSKRFSL